MLTSLKTSKRKFSRRKFLTQKEFIEFYNSQKCPGTSSQNNVIKDAKKNRLKFLKKLLKVNEIKLYSEIDSFLGISLIILLTTLAVFILAILPSEGKTLKSLVSIALKQSMENNKNYSGLIIIVKGKDNFQSSMVPKILSKSGKSIFCNTSNFSHEQFNYLIREGIATFTNDINKTKKRSGNQPLIINALTTKNTDTVIISNEHANQIIKANLKNNFLEKFKVSFVIQ